MQFINEQGLDTRDFNHACKLCGATITNKMLICVECKTKRARIEQEDKFKDKIENVDFIRCKMCGWPDVRLRSHIGSVHDYTKQQYKKEFNSKLVCPALTQKTAFRGKHSKETKQTMSAAHIGKPSWNAGRTKFDHPSLKAIADKATVRMSQLHNNVWHTSVVSRENHPRFGQTSWAHNLTNETSDDLAERSEKASGIYSHRYNLTTVDIYNKNKFIKEYKSRQKHRIKDFDKRCIECNSDSIDIDANHIILEKCFDHYDLSAHSGYNLITLCNSCHSSKGQQVDNAILACDLNFTKMEKEYVVEFNTLMKWLDYAKNRQISMLPIEKQIIQLMSESERVNLANCLFDYFKSTGFPNIQYDESILHKDFDNVIQSFVEFNKSKDELRCYHTSGSRIREHFIKEQYSGLLPLFNNEATLMKIIRNRLGLDWNSNPEFFNFDERTLIRGFRILYPQQSFTQYSCAVAKWIIDNFCNSDTVYDYAAGWGSRLIAAIACNKNYVAVDTNKALVLELQMLSKWLKSINNKDIDISCNDAAVFDCGSIKFAYSCPPYGIQEKYKDATFDSNDEWFVNYMQPVIKNCSEHLVSGGRFVCHISKILSDKVKDELRNNNLHELAIISFLNHKHVFHGGKERANENILVFEK